MTNTEYKTGRFNTKAATRGTLSLFSRTIADLRTREIARAAAIEVLG